VKVLDKVSLRKMLKGRVNCKLCLGKGYNLVIVPNLRADKFRVARPCKCVCQTVRIEEG